MNRTILIAAVQVALLLSGCGGTPEEVNRLVFEGSFADPINIHPGPDDGEEGLEEAISGSINFWHAPTSRHTRYRSFPKQAAGYLTFLVENGYSRVECVPTFNRSGPGSPQCLLIHSDKVKELEAAAKRKLKSITYRNKFKANIMGVEVQMYAITFTYVITSSISGLPKIDDHFQGEAQAALDPATGKWGLVKFALSDSGKDELIKRLASSHEPWDFERLYPSSNPVAQGLEEQHRRLSEQLSVLDIPFAGSTRNSEFSFQVYPDIWSVPVCRAFTHAISWTVNKQNAEYLVNIDNSKTDVSHCRSHPGGTDECVPPIGGGSCAQFKTLDAPELIRIRLYR